MNESQDKNLNVLRTKRASAQATRLFDYVVTLCHGKKEKRCNSTSTRPITIKLGSGASV